MFCSESKPNLGKYWFRFVGIICGFVEKMCRGLICNPSMLGILEIYHHISYPTRKGKSSSHSPKACLQNPKNIQRMLNLSGKGLLNLAPESLTHWPLRILRTWRWEYLGHLFESDIPKTGTPIFMRCSPFCVHTSSMATWSSRWLRRHHSGGTPPQQTSKHKWIEDGPRGRSGSTNLKCW